MASLSEIGGFNAEEHEPNTGFDPLPVGAYTAIIEDSEWKETKAKTGKYLKLTIQVCDGKFSGRKLWINLNLINSNSEAVRIAQGEFSAICRAAGIVAPKDTIELHNIPLSIRVGMKKNKDSGELENVIKKWERLGAVQSGGTSSAPSSAGNGNTKQFAGAGAGNGNAKKAPWQQ